MLKRHGWLIACALAFVGGAAAISPRGREEPIAGFAAPRTVASWPGDVPDADAVRTRALRRAKVWWPPDGTVADVASNPPDPTGALSEAIVRCRFLSKAAGGTTPKFDCVLPDGEIVKVKYGETGEIHAEIAATRLLRALGFGADRMYLVPRVRCYGCPRFPFHLTWALDRLHARTLATNRLPDDRYTDFNWVSVERRFAGAAVEGNDSKGWGWFELDQVDPSVGASRAEIDALRVAAMFLGHWDNKAANQRLVCVALPESPTEPCVEVAAIVQDTGATFGPNKVDLAGWRGTAIWADASRCTISMRRFPYDGGTFADVQISEDGRRLIARQLAAFTDAQIRGLFNGARFREFLAGTPAADLDGWTQTFHHKVHEIAAAGPCPI